MLQFIGLGALVVLLAYCSQTITRAVDRPDTWARYDWHRTVRRLGRRPWAWGGWNLADVAILVALTWFSSFRYLVGTDFSLYSGMYRKLDVHSWWHSLRYTPQEPGFTLFRLVLKSIVGGNPVWLFFATTVLTLVPTFIALKRVAARDFAIAVACFYTLGMWASGLNGLRQAIANSFVFLAATLYERRPRLAAVIAVVAASVHVSAVLVVAILWLTRRWRPAGRGLALVVVGGGLLALAGLGLLGPLLGAINPRYARYLAQGGHGGAGTVVQIVLIGALLIWLWGRARVPAAARTWFVWSSFSVAMLIVGLRVVEFGRLHLYFKTYLVLLLSTMLPRIVRTWRGWVVVGLVLTAYFALYLHFYDGLLPYRVWTGHAR